MSRLRFVVAAVSTVVLAGCGSGHTGGVSGSPPTSTTGASTHVAAPPIQPDQQLQSSTQLQSDLDALKAAPTEGDLLKTVNMLEEHFGAVSGTRASSNDADWQQALNKLQQVLTDVQQLANANSSDPNAPNPLNSSASTSHAVPPPTQPEPRAPKPSPTDIIDEINKAFDLLTKVSKGVAYEVKISNAGPGDVMNDNGVTVPPINCGPAHSVCRGYVLAVNTASFRFAPSSGGTISKIDSSPKGSATCEIRKDKGGAVCRVNGTAGATITITPTWR
jgi:hypothetical protein